MKQQTKRLPLMETIKSLREISSSDLDPFFWTPELIGKPSAWWAHVPFAQWLMATCKPEVFVELGAHNGVSYASFCEAAVRAKTGTRCYAVDHWTGDEHAGTYTDQVYFEFKDFHDHRYQAFSELIRSTFDEAVSHFSDGSIDLLHIDGLHTYEAVKHDYESWFPKLSSRAIVLLHDTNVRSADFGVHLLFEELAKRYPNFEFLHGYGLGVLAVGEDAPEAVKSLCSIEAQSDRGTVRERFAHLGALWHVTTREQLSNSSLHAKLAEEASAQSLIVEQLNEQKTAAQLATTDAASSKATAEVASAEAIAAKAAAATATAEMVAAKAATELASAEAIAAKAAAAAATAEMAAAKAATEVASAEAIAAKAAAAAATAEMAAAKAATELASAEAIAEMTAARTEVDSAIKDIVATTAIVEAVTAEAAAAKASVEAVAAKAAASNSAAELASASAQEHQTAHHYLKNLYARAVRRVVDMRRTIESLAWEVSSLQAQLSEIRDQHTVLSQRYASGFDDPSTGIKSRLKKRILKLMWPLTRRRLKAHAVTDLVRRSIYFDRQWYLDQNPEVGAAGVDPAVHYMLFGAAEGRDPSQWFRGRQYLENNPDVAVAGINPLVHYIKHGKHEGRTFNSPEPHVTSAVNDRVGWSARRSKRFSIRFVSGEPDSPGNIYRVVRYIDAAKANGVDADWMRHGDLSGRLGEIKSCDVLVIWRVAWDTTIETAITLAKTNGVKVIFDVDDLMVAPELAQVKIIDGIRSQFLHEDGVRDHYARIRQTMLAADICSTTTEELAFHMRWAGKTTHVLPNGFDQFAHDNSRKAARAWLAAKDDLVRIGYAGGSRTHQRDLGLAIEAIAKILRENSACRLVLFRTTNDYTPLIDIEEYPSLKGLHDQIEWRPLQPLSELPNEMARFDINLAPLEPGNLFCDAKSELKFFEAALVNVPTVASPTGPFRRAIDHGETGFLAASADDWYVYLKKLIESPELRKQIALQSYHAAMAKFGPLQRALKYGRFVEQLHGGTRAARGFALEAQLASRPSSTPKVYPSDIIFEEDRGGLAEVSVIIPMYNYEKYIREALDSVHHQTLTNIDLVIVDGHSTDNGLRVAVDWAKKHRNRFNRIVVLKNQSNYGLSFCRNSGFSAAESRYVLPLDADNRLLPECCERLLATAKSTGAAYVYPTVQHFGASTKQISNAPYEAQRFVAGNYIDAMALVSKEAWAVVGGYDHIRHGWEDYDFWCRIAEIGLSGEWLPEVLAEYRVHPQSMMTIQTTVPGNYRRLQYNFENRHPWVWLNDKYTARIALKSDQELLTPDQRTRLDDLIHILRCPVTNLKLVPNEDRTALISFDGAEIWPIVEGRPVLSRENLQPDVKSPDHISNELPEEALEIIRSAKGWVLNLSAGGSREKFDHVVEVEYAIFRHTDLVADAHVLPFDDNCFEAIVVMNAFEHYREPHKVSAELLRILKPGGRVMIRTAFLQPLHEPPWHFFNCTRFGLSEWFKHFETEKLHVSDNFAPNHSIAWLASECEAALRRDVSAKSGDNFRNAKVGELVDIWRDPSQRSSPLWTNFYKLPQSAQDVTAAGFEFFGRKSLDKPDLTA